MQTGRRALALALVLALSFAATAEDLPAKTAFLVVLKVLTYDAGFNGRGKGEFVVLIPSGSDAAKAQAMLELAKGSGISRILDRTLRFSVVPLEQLDAQVQEQKASAILLPEGLSAGAAKEVARIGTARKVYTMCIEEPPVRQGLLLGVAVNAGKPQVLINVATARAQGVDFHPSVLRIAKTVQ